MRRRTTAQFAVIGATIALVAGATPAGAGFNFPNDVRLINVNSLKVADIEGGSTANGARAIQWTQHGGANQKFHLDHVSSGTVFRIRNVLSGKVLDVQGGSTANGARVIQWTQHGGDNQKWTVTPAGDGAVRFTNVLSGKVLDVNQGSTADGAPIIQWTQHGGNNQRWFTPAA